MPFKGESVFAKHQHLVHFFFYNHCLHPPASILRLHLQSFLFLNLFFTFSAENDHVESLILKIWKQVRWSNWIQFTITNFIFWIFRFDIRGWFIKQISSIGVPVLLNEFTYEIHYFFRYDLMIFTLLLEVALIFIDSFYKKIISLIKKQRA